VDDLGRCGRRQAAQALANSDTSKAEQLIGPISNTVPCTGSSSNPSWGKGPPDRIYFHFVRSS
ncbi:MAG: hypothetical protein ACREBC_31245, partial [Pyrinomonadaceae bacterium]